jgi:hypothetical protein
MSDNYVAMTAVFIISSIVGFGTVIYFLDDLQRDRFVPELDTLSCPELKEWIIEKRIDGNGYEKVGAKQFADIYPVKCNERLEN